MVLWPSAVPVFGSTMKSALPLASAIYSLLRSGESAQWLGSRSVGRLRTTWRVVMSMTETLASPEFITMASDGTEADAAARALWGRSARMGDRLRLSGMARLRPSSSRRESFMDVCGTGCGNGAKRKRCRLRKAFNGEAVARHYTHRFFHLRYTVRGF